MTEQHVPQCEFTGCTHNDEHGHTSAVKEPRYEAVKMASERAASKMETFRAAKQLHTPPAADRLREAQTAAAIDNALRFDWDVYLAGSLRNEAIPSIANDLETRIGGRVFADWFAAGPEADDHWKAYYQARGLNYRDTLNAPASVNTFEFDKKHMRASRTMVLALPAGRSAHLELGWFTGLNRKSYILLSSTVDERWDVMYQFASGVTHDIDELTGWLKNELNT